MRGTTDVVCERYSSIDMEISGSLSQPFCLATAKPGLCQPLSIEKVDQRPLLMRLQNGVIFAELLDAYWSSSARLTKYLGQRYC